MMTQVVMWFHLVIVKFELIWLHPALDVVDVLPPQPSITVLLALRMCFQPLKEVLQGHRRLQSDEVQSAART